MWPNLRRDGCVLVVAYRLRLAAYGCVSVILGVYLGALGFAPALIGLIFTAAVAGGGVMTAVFAGLADRWGQRRGLLVIGALLMAASGAVFASSSSPVLLGRCDDWLSESFGQRSGAIPLDRTGDAAAHDNR